MLVLTLLACSAHIVHGTHDFGGQTADWTAYVPDDDGTAYGAAVLLPADNSDANWLPRKASLQAWANREHSIVLSIDAPGPDGSGCWWTPHKHQRALFLADVMQVALYDAHLIDPARVHLGGWSGGAFLAFGAPFYTELPFLGGLVGVCGADVPREDSTTDWCEVDEYSDDPEIELDRDAARSWVNGRKVYIARNDDDDWVTNIDSAGTLWTELGAQVQTYSAGDGGHCALDVVGQLVEGLESVK